MSFLRSWQSADPCTDSYKLHNKNWLSLGAAIEQDGNYLEGPEPPRMTGARFETTLLDSGYPNLFLWFAYCQRLTSEVYHLENIGISETRKVEMHKSRRMLYLRDIRLLLFPN